MKACSKCGRTYPDHVDFCLRDGHPLVVDQEEFAPEAEATPEPHAEPVAEAVVESLVHDDGGVALKTPAAQSGDQNLPLDLRSTTDAFFPALAQSGGSDLEAKADEAQADPDSIPTEPIEIPRAPTEADVEALNQTIASELGDSVSTAETDVIGVAQFREILAKHREAQEAGIEKAEAEARAAQPQESIDTDKFSVAPIPGDQSLVQTTLIPRNWKEAVPDEVDEAEEDYGESMGEVDPAFHETTPLETPDEPEEVENTGEISRPFFIGEVEEGEIPSGFEESYAPEDGEEETTGVLSQPFIAGEIDINEGEETLAEGAINPFDTDAISQSAVVGRSRRETRELSLEEALNPNGAAPPKGAFRRRAAFSHWPVKRAEPKPAAKPPVNPWAETPPPPKIPPKQPPIQEVEPLEPAPSSGSMRYVLMAALLLVGALGAWYVISGSDTTKTPVASQVDTTGGGSHSANMAGKASDRNADKHVAKAPPVPVEKTPTPAKAAADENAPEDAQTSPTPVKAEGDGEKEGTPPPQKGNGSQKVAAAPKAQSSRPPKSKPKTSAKTASRPKVSAPSTLKVISSPAGAQVYVEGTRKGQTPYNTRMVPGNYSVRIVKEGFRTETRRARLKTGETQELAVTLAPLSQEPVAPVPVLIISNEIGASVYLDGKKVGETPARHAIEPGSYKMRVIKEGFKPAIQNIVVKKGGAAPQKVFANLAKE